MRAVIQAVSSANVRVNGGEPRPIGPGLVILLGVKDTDTLDIVPKLAEKCAGLRIFKDENDKLNLSAKDLGYSALVVSQFTLYGDTKKASVPASSRRQDRRWLWTLRAVPREINKQASRMSSTASSARICRCRWSTKAPAPSSSTPTSGIKEKNKP